MAKNPDGLALGIRQLAERGARQFLVPNLADLAADVETALNLTDFALPARSAPAARPTVTAVLGTATDTGLADGCCDAILLRMVYHHFEDPAAMRRHFSAIAGWHDRKHIADIDRVSKRQLQIRLAEGVTVFKGSGFDQRTDGRPHERFRNPVDGRYLLLQILEGQSPPGYGNLVVDHFPNSLQRQRRIMTRIGSAAKAHPYFFPSRWSRSLYQMAKSSMAL